MSKLKALDMWGKLRRKDLLGLSDEYAESKTDAPHRHGDRGSGAIRAGDVVSPIDMEPSFSLPCRSLGVVVTAKACIIVIITANQPMEDSCPGTQATTFGFAGVICIEVSTVKESMGSRICNVKIGHAQEASQQSRDIAAGGYFAG
ncbi:predicted protein [Histoplasma capsulatum var. duboisii H88]|uniref:Predicted protein n=1 Tax=Ajellomyces capsulatus (strain H88) TaxID=544711 RepID=F0URZ0_AJEC8|nr:predicted protein [Histoplasma capsulatum var. duboisii H88]